MQYFYGMLLLLFVHWIADFVCQSDRVALNKSKSNEVLVEHVTIYTIGLLIGSIPLCIFILDHPGGMPLGEWLLLNAFLHFCTDYVTSRINARLYTNHRHYFFVMIGFDQLIHFFTLGLTMVWLLK